MPPSIPTRRRQKLSTKDRLLQVGIQLFATHGFHGTSIKRIVNAAKVNERMIYHYFGSKQKYYQSVLRQVYHKMEELADAAFASCQSVEAIIREGVRFYFAFHQNNPEFTSLILRENLDHEKLINTPDFILAKHPLLQQLEKVIQQDIAQGKVRPDLNAKYLVVSLIGSCQIYHSNRFTLAKSLKLDLGSKRSLEEGMEHTSRLLLRGVAPAGAAGR